MPTIPLVVEGDTDAAFSYRLISRMSLPEDTELEIRNVGGKGNLQPATTALIKDRVSQLIITEDLNHGTADQIVQSYKQVVSTFLGLPTSNLSPPGDSFQAGDVTVTVIPTNGPPE